MQYLRLSMVAVMLGVSICYGQDATSSPAPFSSSLRDPLKGSLNTTESTLAEQTEVAVTAYNNDLALVRDVRKLKLLPGEFSLRFADVAQQIRPQTVSLKSANAPGSLRVLEQNYEYDLISPSKLMEKYVGKPVRLQNFDNQIRVSDVEAELLSVNEGPVYKVNDEIYLGHPGTVVLPDIPEELISKPSLIWLLDNDQSEQTVEVTYLTGGFTWQADYVLTLSEDAANLDLAGWVTVTNSSGATYNNAQLKLVAGEVNVVRIPEDPSGGLVFDLNSDGLARSVQPTEESFAEYHLYTFPRKTTIKQNQTKQLNLLQASGAKSVKKYEYRGQPEFYFTKFGPLPEQKVETYLEFDNKEANQLGMPLPAGTMRVYQADKEGMLQFAGEDRIEHTPKDETIRLKLGNAFDIVAERVQTDFQQLAPNLTQSSFEITLRNHKDQDIVVDVVEPMVGDWSIQAKSHEFTKKDANTAVFSLPVPKDGETKLTYTVRVKT
ncbi:MAG: DUF4139 domain-containing protein [Candidatus Hydrogenedentes bacterium]|nr:DUF4139 domain-containing protein [Candidatus Hydrogenedentota bacterium]